MVLFVEMVGVDFVVDFLVVDVGVYVFFYGDDDWCGFWWVGGGV